MSVRDLLRDAFVKHQSGFVKTEPNEVWVSELSTCQVKKQFDKEAEQRGEFNVFPLLRGVALHKGLQALLTEFMGDKVKAVEYRVEKEVCGYKLKGSIDVLLSDNTVVEIKTVSRLSQPFYPEHVFQVLTYLHMLNAERGVILYVLNNEVREVVVLRDGNVITDVGSSLVPVMTVNDDVLCRAISDFVAGKRVHPFNECSRCIYNQVCPFSITRV